MRSLRSLLFATLLAGCIHNAHPEVDGAMLGRVVIYRNGVAYYERHAQVADGKLTVHVPRERVDDFLKSLTVVDAVSKKPLAITIPRKEADDGSYLTMTLETPDRQAADVLMTYVTEAPAWKPSYRVVVADGGKVMLEGWAIVDNVSGEDWKDVLVGVGASSAMSFRYDLWSVRRIDRDLLQGEDRFAVAPPTGVSPYAEGGGEELASLDGSEAGQADSAGVSFSGSSNLQNQYVVDGVNTTGIASNTTTPTVTLAGTIDGKVLDTKTGGALAGVTVVATTPGQPEQVVISDDNGGYRLANLPPGSYTLTFYYADATSEQKAVAVKAGSVAQVSARIAGSSASGETIVVAGTAPRVDQTSTTQGIVIERDYVKNVPVPGRTYEAVLGSAAGSQGDSYGAETAADNARRAAEEAKKQTELKLKKSIDRVVSSHKDVVVEVHARNEGEAKARAASVRNKLIDGGVPASKIHVSPKIGPGEGDGVRLVAIAPGAKPETAPPAATRGAGGDAPVGESRFMADRPMTVKAGTSAMIAMVHGETDGGVVYLYDPISDRGDDRFAFRSVRLVNPTDDTLEPGPVTVFGDGRFIGEGITEPVPPKASVVVPFALDRQILISHHGDETEQIAKLETVQRGVVTAEIQHRRTTTFTISSRLTEPAKVYLRHKLEDGWKLVEAPERSMKVGDSQLYEVDVGPGATTYVTIAESTPLERSIDLSSDAALDMMKVYINEPDATPELKQHVEALLATHRSAADLVDKIATLRDELQDYRSRAGELHAQLVTLKAVHTGGELMASLKSKLNEIDDKAQKLTIAIVDSQEQLMLARVKFQNQLAELHLTDATVTKR